MHPAPQGYVPADNADSWGTIVLRRLAVLLLVLSFAALPSSVSAASGSAAPLEISASTQTLEFGKSVKIKGAPGLGYVGREVVLQKRYGPDAPWRVERSQRVSSSGEFTMSDRPSTMTRRWYRVVMPKTRTKSARTSNVVLVQVMRWYYLSEAPQVDSNRFDEGRASIAGLSYPKSVMNSNSFWWEDNPWAEWNLGRSCKTLRATVGLLDSSPSTSKSAFSAYRDGSLSRWGPLGIGASKFVELTVSGTFRLKLENNYAGGSDGGMAGWGDARVFCSRKPG